MDTTPAFEGLASLASGERFDATTSHPPDGGVLDPVYDYDAVSLSPDDLRGSDPARFAPLLPFAPAATVSLGEGDTPLIEAPSIADELGVARVLVKDEGANPTGTLKDRELALAVTATHQHGAEAVALPTTGVGGQAAAAYAARAGLASHAFVPTRSTFITKAMTNVHAGQMKVVEGRFPDAAEAFTGAMADHGPESDEPWYSLAAFATPYRHEGTKPVAYETLAALDFEPPDHVVYPAEGLAGAYGFAKGAREFHDLGLVDGVPALHVAEAAGCAPLTRAFEAGADDIEPWELPDTVCGGLELPDPAGAAPTLEAVRETGGSVRAAEDDDILESAVALAQREGIEASVAGGAAAAVAWAMSEAGAFDADDTVVLVNTGAGSKDADMLRSHLMGQGW